MRLNTTLTSYAPHCSSAYQQSIKLNITKKKVPHIKTYFHMYIHKNHIAKDPSHCSLQIPVGFYIITKYNSITHRNI